MVGVEEGLLDGLTAADGAMVSQQHDLVVHAQVSGQPVSLSGLHHDALVAVVGHVPEKARLLT